MDEREEEYAAIRSNIVQNEASLIQITIYMYVTILHFCQLRKFGTVGYL